MWLPSIIVSACIIGSINGLTPLWYGKSHGDYNPISKTQFTWTGGNFDWPCKATQNIYKSSGRYVRKNIIATRGVIYNNEAILALPRFRSGIPATLVKVFLKSGACDATLIPFPSWSMQEEGNCNALQSATDLFLDQNQILWVLDSGIVNSLGSPVKKCPPKVVAISLKTSKLLKIISLEKLVTTTSRLQNLVVDYSLDGRCFVYVSDAQQRAILVHDVQACRGFRVILPKAIVYGCTKKDVLYIALVRNLNGANSLYLTYLGSKKMYAIQTEHLRKGNTQGRIVEVGEKPQRLVIIGTDNGNAIFFRYEGRTEIYRWDTTSGFEPKSFKVVHRSSPCELATHVMVDYYHDQIRVLESNFPDYIQGTVGCGAIQQISIMQY